MPSINMRAYSNCANILLVWEFDELIKDCVGFTIWRAEENASKDKVALMSSVGFEDERRALNGPPKPSTERPFQRCMWNDWTAPRSKKLVYSVETFFENGAGQAKLASNWSDPVSVGAGDATAKLSA